jgi:hypothetical protein
MIAKAFIRTVRGVYETYLRADEISEMRKSCEEQGYQLEIKHWELAEEVSDEVV